MTETIEAATRKQVAEFLPRAIEKALASYYDYLNDPETDIVPEDSKPAKKTTKTQVFKDYHLAGKVAVSHIDLLLKLARWADLPVGSSGEPVVDLEYVLTHMEEQTADLPEEDEDEEVV